MQDFLAKALDFLEDKLGALSAFLVPVASSLKVAIADKDVAKINSVITEWRKRSHEARETFDAGDELCLFLEGAISDGELTAIEAGQGLERLQRFIDEAEDIATGVDEDDVETV